MPEISVSGRRSGVARATWGQSGILRIIAMLGAEADDRDFVRTAVLPAGTGIPDALSWLTDLIGAYDVLRTRYVERADGWVQILDAAGAVEVDLVETGEANAETTRELTTELGRTRFDLRMRTSVPSSGRPTDSGWCRSSSGCMTVMRLHSVCRTSGSAHCPGRPFGAGRPDRPRARRRCW